LDSEPWARHAEAVQVGFKTLDEASDADFVHFGVLVGVEEGAVVDGPEESRLLGVLADDLIEDRGPSHSESIQVH
jgi:hypothetical protein